MSEQKPREWFGVKSIIHNWTHDSSDITVYAPDNLGSMIEYSAYQAAVEGWDYCRNGWAQINLEWNKERAKSLVLREALEKISELRITVDVNRFGAFVSAEAVALAKEALKAFDEGGEPQEHGCREDES